MKKTLLLIISTLFIANAFAQNTITSVADGNANNPFTWDCTCWPAPGDNVTINHNVTMNVDWIIGAGGSITVGANGSFIEDANHRAILVDDNGSSFVNHGVTDLTGISFTNGAIGINNGYFDLDSGMIVAQNSVFDNNGEIHSLDSLWVTGTFNNNGGSFLGDGDILAQGQFTNNGSIITDSLVNTGVFNNASVGVIYATEFGNLLNSSEFNNMGHLNVGINFYNTGVFDNRVSGNVNIINDFYTGDSLVATSELIADGTILVGNDFWNNKVVGGSGKICVSNGTNNFGTFNGTIDFCDNTGSGFDINLGTVAGTITFCNSNCFVGLEEEEENVEITLYPNPITDNAIITVDNSQQYNLKVFNGMGALVLDKNFTNSIELNRNNFTSGMYFYTISNENKSVKTDKFIVK